MRRRLIIRSHRTAVRSQGRHSLAFRFLALLPALVLLIGEGACTAQKANGRPPDNEQALIVYIRLSDRMSGTPIEQEQLFKLEESVSSAIEKSGAGEYDGNEIGNGFFTMYSYGPSATRLWEVAAPIIKGFRPPPGSYGIRRYGKPGTKQDRISIE